MSLRFGLAAIIATALLALLCYGLINWKRISPLVVMLVVWNGLLILLGFYPFTVPRYIAWGVSGEVLAGLIWWLHTRGLGTFPIALTFIIFLLAEIYLLPLPPMMSGVVLLCSVFAVVEAISRGEE